MVEEKAEKYANDAKRKTERRIDREVDDAIDQGLNKIFNNNKKKKKKEAEEKIPPVTDPDVYDTAGGGSSTYDLEAAPEIRSNSFIGSFKMNYTVQRNGQVDNKGANQYYFDQTRSALRQETPEGPVTVIYDLSEQSMTTVKKGKDNKVAVILDSPESKKIGLRAEEIKLTTLTSTRTIEGYACTKNIIETPTDYITLWVANAIPCNFDLLMRSVNAQSKEEYQKLTSGYGVYGLPLEITVESTVRDEIYSMKLTEIVKGKVDKSVFETTGADVTDLRGF